ncbi:hypothetical protein A1O3_05641 [Capronia epimyces CBS 606.96]|uniref:NADPH-dependent FMN reductase-like domain-containing protein n=1 Tax=Capronia epimyces CBS 606.96 TaxID=1182542 RepID=W9Y6W0_9EURO|nr:uncharacterized protein A1O3_05641 [Capronia epimyces CBS 606.96]EXJ84966.1 hypothetical protein A1O3_05641 [Capronia epimyces CBS 606.96]
MALTARDSLSTEHVSKQIGVIVCSQRKPRAGLQIGTFVLDSLKQYQRSHPSSQPAEIILIDLADHPLPLYDEPGIPSQIHSSSGYTHAHTRAWSDLINSFAAFVFVTPQYNWGCPASIKNAIDYLYHEWTGKPAMVVSYGGHGGGKAAAQLKEVLHGLRMKVVPNHVELAFPGRDFLVKAAGGADLGLRVVDDNGNDNDNDNGTQETVWAKEAADIHKAFEDLLGLLAGQGSEA